MLLPQAITPDSNHAGVTEFKGFAIYEDSSAAAAIEFRAGAVDGPLLWPVNLAADTSAAITFVEPIAADAGVYVKETSGSITGTLFF